MEGDKDARHERRLGEVSKSLLPLPALTTRR